VNNHKFNFKRTTNMVGIVGIERSEAKEIGENYLETLRSTLLMSVMAVKGIGSFIRGFKEGAVARGANASDPVSITIGKDIVYEAPTSGENSHDFKLTPAALKEIKTAIQAPQQLREKVSISVGDKEFYAVSNSGQITRDLLNLHPEQAPQQIPQAALEQMSESMARVSAMLGSENPMESMSARIAILEESQSLLVETVQKQQVILEQLLFQSEQATKVKAPEVKNSKLGNYLRGAASAIKGVGRHTEQVVNKVRQFGQWLGNKVQGAIKGVRELRDNAIVNAATMMLNVVGDKHPDGSRTFTTDSNLHFERTPDGAINIARGAREVMSASQLSPQVTPDDLKELNQTRELAEEINQSQALEQKQPSTALSR